MDHRQKLKRARVHLIALNERVNEFIHSDPYREVIDHHPRPGNSELLVIHWKKTRELPAEDFAVILGDAIYNMRSSLDHLAYELTCAAIGAKPEKSSSMFPIHPAVGSYMDAGVRACSRMSPPVQDIIEKMQPYHAGNDAPNHALSVLNDLSNTDKHRHLTFTGSVSTEQTFSLRESECRDVRLLGQHAEVRYGPFDDQTDVGRILVQHTGPNPHVAVDSNIMFEIAFPETGPAAGKLIFPELEGIFVHIRDKIFPDLEKHL